MKYYKVTYQDKEKIHKKLVNEEELAAIQDSYIVIKIREKVSKNTFFIKWFNTISSKELLLLFTELELMMRSHLTLYEALGIIEKTTKKKTLKAFLSSILKALKHGHSLYEAIKPYETKIDPIVVAFFKLSHNKGNSYLMVKSMCDVLQTKQDNRALLFSSLSYPLFIWCSFCIAMWVIFQVVIPKFEYIFMQYNMNLPLYTTLLLDFKAFLMHYYELILLSVLILFLMLRIKIFQTSWQQHKDKWLIRYCPIIGGVYRYYELHNLFVGLRILMNSKHEFIVALENSQLLLKNQYLLDKIHQLQQHIHNGMSLYEAFLQVEIFDELVLNVIHSAQVSSSLNEALEKIELYYKNKFTTMIKRFSSVIEPLFFVIMMLLILWVMLAIFTPIWNMSEMINL